MLGTLKSRATTVDAPTCWIGDHGGPWTGATAGAHPSGNPLSSPSGGGLPNRCIAGNSPARDRHGGGRGLSVPEDRVASSHVSAPTDRCRLCGAHAKLSYEHLPPRAAYNSEPVKSYKLDQWWALEAGEPARYESEQRGAGEYALCESCNNNTGSWYVPELGRLIEAGATVVRSFPGRNTAEDPAEIVSVRMKIVGSYPGRFTKEMIAMLLAINDPSFGDEHPELRKFVVEREQRGLPERYRLYLSIFDRDVARQVGRYTAMRGIGTPSPHAFDATELSYPPYTYVLTVAEQPDEERLGDISELTNYAYTDQVDELVLELPVNWTLLPERL
jgi:hypothetical protein